jgi:TolB-like protein
MSLSSLDMRSLLWVSTKQINKIRDALGDSAENPRFIETVARRGYRFLADVEAINAPSAQPEATLDVGNADGASAPGDVWKKLRHSRAWRLVGFGQALLFAAVVLWIVYPWNASSKIRSLAVLPLENLSGDPSQDYFAEGMTDELITDLGQISTLRVISRSSVMTYKSVHKPLAEIARELDVQAVVEGSVLRSGERVRITAQSIEVPPDRHIWARSYEGDLRDTLTLQNTVARIIAQQIQAVLNKQEKAALEKSRVVKPEAYEAYLKGRYFWNKRTGDGLKKAIEYFTVAIEKDSNYAEAYAGLADSYALSGDREYGILSPQDASLEAKAAATKALDLDDTLGEAHTSRAFALDLYDWDWSAAETEYRLALALNPSYATAHHWYAWHLMVIGRTDEGILELRKAEGLDPLSLIIRADLADALSIAHRYNESVQQSERTLEMDPNFALAHYQLGQAFVQQRLYNEAIVEFQRAISGSGNSGERKFRCGLEYCSDLCWTCRQRQGDDLAEQGLSSAIQSFNSSTACFRSSAIRRTISGSSATYRIALRLNIF